MRHSFAPMNVCSLADLMCKTVFSSRWLRLNAIVRCGLFLQIFRHDQQSTTLRFLPGLLLKPRNQICRTLPCHRCLFQLWAPSRGQTYQREYSAVSAPRRWLRELCRRCRNRCHLFPPKCLSSVGKLVGISSAKCLMPPSDPMGGTTLRSPYNFCPTWRATHWMWPCWCQRWKGPPQPDWWGHWQNIMVHPVVWPIIGDSSRGRLVTRGRTRRHSPSL